MKAIRDAGACGELGARNFPQWVEKDVIEVGVKEVCNELQIGQ
jgi:hypothetical protein